MDKHLLQDIDEELKIRIARNEGYNYGLFTLETNIIEYIEHLMSFDLISDLQGYQYQQGYIAALQHVSRYIRVNGRNLRVGENK